MNLKTSDYISILALTVSLIALIRESRFWAWVRGILILEVTTRKMVDQEKPYSGFLFQRSDGLHFFLYTDYLIVERSDRKARNTSIFPYSEIKTVKFRSLLVPLMITLALFFAVVISVNYL